MRHSRYNFSVPHGDSYLVANLLSRAVVELSGSAFERYCRLDLSSDESDCGDLRQALIDSLFVVENDFDERAYLTQCVNRARYNDRNFKLVISPTMDCNYGCHYCFEDKSKEILGEKDQGRLLEFVARKLPGKESLAVQWFGGEPLLALDVIDNLSTRFLQISSAAGAGYAASMVTNGALLTDDVARRLKTLGITRVQVTLDGDQRLHDKTRRESDGRSSYDLLIRNISTASRHLSVQLRIHVAPFSVGNIKTLIRDLAKTTVTRTATEIYFAPLFNYVPGQAASLRGIPIRQQFSSDDKRFFSAEQFAQVETTLYKLAVKHGFPLPTLFDTPFSICTAVEDNTFVVGPRGNIYKCYFDLSHSDQRVGDLTNGILPSANLLKWANHNLARDDECDTCDFLPVCFGGCSKKWHTDAPKETICTPLRYNLHDLLPLFSDHDRIGT